jgi:hypothetical protein
MSSKEITSYNKKLDKTSKEICDYLEEIISEVLPKAEGKVWHGHPVWFIKDNPVVGYSKQKKGIQLLFWSGQSFDEDDLVKIGKFKAAGHAFESVSEIKKTAVKRWLQKSKKFQWDYANLIKNRKLVKLTNF